MPSCSQCTAAFPIPSADKKYYEEWGVPPPQRCPDCRHQNRCAFRNERTLYKQQCGICTKNIITIYSLDSPYPVLCAECWYGDKWDPLRVGRDFDFNRPFFEQFAELQKKVPRLALNNSRSVNSDYCNMCVGNKDCYLIFASDDNHECMQSDWINRCEDTFNSSYLADCRQCIECVDGDNLHRCILSQQMKNCFECILCFDMIGCKNCFGCVGLRNVEYYIYNQPVPKEEYAKRLAEVFKEKLSNQKELKKLKKWFEGVKEKTPRRYAMVINSEACTGDYIINSNGCKNCFDINDSERCSYCYFLVQKTYNCFDVSFGTEARNAYQCMSVAGEGIRFSTVCWYSSNILYSDLCLNSEELFGCVGLNKMKHCILNKKYKPDEYKELRNKIVAHMHKTGEWGQFFPTSISPFAYNETVANDFYPLSKKEALAQGFRWCDTVEKKEEKGYGSIPDDIKGIGDDILEQKLACETCGKGYRIMKRELNFYKRNYLPLPSACIDCRHKGRLQKRNAYKIYTRECSKCKKKIQTTYSPDRPESIYCAECYYKEVY